MRHQLLLKRNNKSWQFEEVIKPTLARCDTPPLFCMKLYTRTYMSRSIEKTTVWTLRNVSTLVSLRSSHRLIRVDTFRLRGIEL